MGQPRHPVITIGTSNEVNEKYEIKVFRKGRVYRKLAFEENSCM